MKVFRGLPNAAARAPCALTIGNFDGVHRGHQALLARVRAAADRLGLESAVMTFEPHPREFFAHKMGDMSKAPPRIANLRDKLQALENNGVDRVIVEHFCDAFAGQSPQSFVEKVLVEGLHVKWLMVGDDFCYGARRAGNVAMLAEAGRRYGFEVEVLPTVRNGETRISSSAVRSALAEGNFPHAQALLGHPYSISGHVIHGAKLGRDIGFPTLNLRVPHRPALAGIFIVQVHGLAPQPLPAVASLGVRPTVEDAGRVLLEVHVFDFAQNCYGKVVRVEFLQKIRDEEKFIDLPTLVKAIERDAGQARAFFAANSVTDRI
ncbi:bifunctional riboflavin kinase/FAD synthetase [Duganella sp. Root1480D1]|uniref:bifunctional riboflavin kinase/FAD synthetase n=1 Tax=Duganella sp. Root1480D1 TaxID=1736471 RepID=UPI0007099FE5|nr:bifunctional riboflavin kinase/FAD synthetase [Duganella sp. Root1480D1]KQZ43403.1 bifunctional riboflavin kinase/FMN adenylyltransferase [Duganella sp. Root1480D1]